MNEDQRSFPGMPVPPPDRSERERRERIRRFWANPKLLSGKPVRTLKTTMKAPQPPPLKQPQWTGPRSRAYLEELGYTSFGSRSTCKCGTEIHWCVTPSGRKMPLERREGGLDPHHAWCSNAARHRTKKKKVAK